VNTHEVRDPQQRVMRQAAGLPALQLAQIRAVAAAQEAELLVG